MKKKSGGIMAYDGKIVGFLNKMGEIILLNIVFLICCLPVITVVPGIDVGWSRVGQGNADGSGSDSAVFNGSVCQVTYEQIAAVCGEDVSTWGSTMQCESSGNCEVYSVAVGTAE